MRFGYRSGRAFGLILLWLIPGVLMAQSGLSVGSGQAQPGQTVELPIQLHGAPEALQLELSFDDDRVDLLDVIADGGLLIDYALISAGRVRVVAWTEQCPDARGLGTGLASVRFSIAATAPPGVVDVFPENALLVDPEGQAISPADLSTGAITILGGDGELSEPYPVPGPGLIALILLALGLSLSALLIVRKRPGLLMVVMVVGAAGLMTTDAGSDSRVQGGSVEGPDFTGKVDIILERQAFDPALDCNDDGVIDARDLVCARNAFCTEEPIENQPPSLEAIADRELLVGQVLSIQPQATDPNLPDDVLSFSLEGGPAGVSLARSSGGMTWAPVDSQVGQWPMTLTVTDAGGLSDSASFVVTVMSIGSPPAIAAIPDQILLVGEMLDITAQASDPDLPDDVLTFSLTRAPQGMSINPTTGRITWTPGADRVGAHDVSVQVSDQIGLLDATAFVVQVRAPNRAPVALDDEYRVRRGDTLSVPAPGVMDNDFDPDGDPITAELITGPNRGVLDFRGDGSFDYTPGIEHPAFGVELVDSFRDMVIDGIARTWRVTDGTVVAGDLTGNGRSELLAIGQRGSGIANTQYLTALSFNEDDELDVLWYWNGWPGANPVLDPDWNFAMRGARDPVIGDIDGDGVPEVIVSAYCRGEILIFGNLGERLFSSQAGSTSSCPFTGSGNVADAGRISLVDLTGNGLPEILYGFSGTMRAFDNQANLLWETEIPNFRPGGDDYDYSVADVNLDGTPNIFFGGALLDAEGNLLWTKATNPLSSDWIGRYAVANLNDDPFAELIYWGIGPDLIVFDHQGNCLWQARKSSAPNPGPTLGCPSAVQIPDLPTANPGFHTGLIVADITGDGQPRIVIGNRTTSDGELRNRVIAFNADGTPFWSVPALLSSGLSVRVNQINAFDFTGNGVMELVVTGVNGTVVLDGRNGQTLFEIPADSDNPGLGVEFGQDMLYSIIVDLDGDGAAELVVSSQGGWGFSGETATGLFVYRDPQNRWMPTRGIWNQWAYSITNVNPDGSIPSPAQPNWLSPGLNNYRVNALPVAERRGAVLVDSFRQITIDGNTSTWKATLGSVVAGDLTGNGRSELLAIGHHSSGIANTQYLTALSFNEDDELELLWYWNGWLSAVDNPDFAMAFSRDPVIGDLDNNGVPEVIVSGYCNDEILVFSNLGEPLLSTQAGLVPDNCSTTSGQGGIGRVALADLTGNGFPEILTNAGNRLRAFQTSRNGDGQLDGVSLLWEAQAPNFSPGTRQYDYAVADVNLDGRPNIWFGGALFDADGNVMWSKATNPSSNDWMGEYAVANLNDDPFAELIYWGVGPELIVFDHQGHCLWQARMNNPNPTLGCPSIMTIPDFSPGFLRGGLMVGDIAGDGVTRIVIGGRSNSDGVLNNGVAAFNPDGTLFWFVPTVLSSGSSVRPNQVNGFDLTGNDVMELVVTGVNGTVVLDGRSGRHLFEIPADASNPGFGTSTGHDMLYSIIVDLDGDGAAELVVSSQGSAGLSGETPTGLFVYRDPRNQWMPARGVWNQWAYSVTNINEDLSIPSPAERNWLTRGLNNYRINAFMPGESGALDTFTYQVSDGELPSNEATVWIDIRRPNRPPMFITSPVTLAGVGFDYRYRVVAVDPDPGDEVTLVLNQGPAGMILGAEQVLRWQPGVDLLGEHPVILSAIDLEGEITTQEFVVEVVEPVAVPDVIGLGQADAESALDAAGFRSGRITERFDEEFAAGLVAAQQPGGGSLQVPGRRIDLEVSKGPAPIDDSTPPEFPVESIRVEPDSLALVTGETVRLKAFAVFADDSTQLITRAVNWSSDSPAASVNANGRVSSVTGGTATISAEYDGVIGQAMVQVTARDTSDNEGPTALIAAPAEGEVLFGPTEIIGTAFDTNLVRYELALSPADEGLWTLISQGTSNVDDDVLGVFDPTVLLNGFYDIRLRVLDAGGNESTDLITVQADGEQKVGLFTLAFTDLTLPLGGLPIVIERVYDSRDRSLGDFGMGWRLGLRSIELTCSSKLGEDWFVAKSGLSFSLLPMREKACAISLPGGRMEVFDFVVSPSNSPFVPLLTVTGQLQPRPGTLGEIEILDNTNFLILDQQPGEVWLYDDVTFNPFNPVELRYTMPDGTVFEFTNGKVTRVTDANGNSLAFTLDGIEHSSGIGVDFERDVLGRITAITDPSGHTQNYAYSANGDLMSHTDALGHTTRFFYNTRHGLLRIEDPLGNSAIRSEYDERGRLIALVDAAGNRTEHEFDDEARLKTTTFPDGSTRMVAYDERGNIQTQTRLVTIDGVPVFSEQTWEYDEFGNPTRTVDADGVVEESEWNGEREWTRRVIDPGGLELIDEQDFDVGGRLARSIDALGRERTYEYDARGNVTRSPGPGGLNIGLNYDSAGRLLGIENPRAERTNLEYNIAGQVAAREVRTPEGQLLSRTEFVLDQNGRILTRTKMGLVDGETSRTTTMTRDAMGRVLSVTDPLGETSAFEYDANSNVTAIIDPMGARIEMDYDERELLVERRLPDGATETFAYDFAGRQIARIDPDGIVHQTDYDELGHAVAERVDGEIIVRRSYSPGGRLVATIDALGHRTDHEYDNAGRMIRTLLPQVHDAISGNEIRPEVLMEYNAVGQRTAVIDPLGRRTEYQYDDAGNLERVIHPDNTVREHLFDAAGKHLSVTDEEDYSTQFEYDAAGRLIRVLQPAPTPGEPRPETLYYYDSFGQLRSRVDALGQVTAFEYDAAGRQVRKIMPDGSSRTQEFNGAGHMTSVIDFDGTELHFDRDALGRLLSRTGPSLTESISYTAAGRRASVSDSRGLTMFEYDNHGRLIGFTEGDGLGIEYEYDANGRIVSLTVEAESTEYTWDALGRLISVSTAEGTVSYGYDLAGQLISKTLPNGLVREADYDLRGRPLEVSFYDPTDTLIEQFVSTYSPRGKRLSVTTADGVIESYDYDPIGRLIEATRSGANSFDLAFEYDSVGNRLRQVFNGDETLYNYGSNHELIAVGSDSFSYDARGNRTSAVINGESVDYQWDDFGRLVGVTTPDGQAQFQYDVNDRRVARVIDGERTRQLIDPLSVSGFSQVVMEYDDAGQVLAHWHYGRQVLAQHRQGTVHHYGMDHRGSVSLLTDSAGQVSDRYDYLPFGDLHLASGNTPNPYRFNSERWEPAARAYDLRQRSYDSCTGTFVSRDPFPGFQNRPFSLHAYQFGDADPVNHIDPLGLLTLPEISFTTGLQGSFRGVNIGASGQVLCRAKRVVDWVSTTVSIINIAQTIYDIHSGTLTSRDFVITLPKAKELKIQFEAKEINWSDFNAGSLPKSAELSLSFNLEGRQLKIRRKEGKWSATASRAIDLFELTTCLAKFADVKIAAETKLDGSLNLELKGVIEMAVDEFAGEKLSNAMGSIGGSLSNAKLEQVFWEYQN